MFKIKINWGAKIALLYIAFVLFILTLVIASTTKDFQLVTKDYYQQELVYNDRINEMKQAAKLTHPLEINYQANNEELSIKFPEMASPEQGNIWLYRPSNAKHDQVYPIDLNSTDRTQVIQTQQLAQGLWRIKVQWQANQQSYFVEKIWVKD